MFPFHVLQFPQIPRHWWDEQSLLWTHHTPAGIGWLLTSISGWVEMDPEVSLAPALTTGYSVLLERNDPSPPWPQGGEGGGFSRPKSPSCPPPNQEILSPPRNLQEQFPLTVVCIVYILHCIFLCPPHFISPQFFSYFPQSMYHTIAYLLKTSPHSLHCW